MSNGITNLEIESMMSDKRHLIMISFKFDPKPEQLSSTKDLITNNFSLTKSTEGISKGIWKR